MSEIKQDMLPDGSIRLSSDNCSFEYKRVGPGVLLVVIIGNDAGQFGTATLDQIVAAIARDRKLELFIDAREAVGAAVSVSDEWTRFFSSHRQDLTRVHVLVGSKVIYLTIAIAQHLSRTGNLIQIYSDSEIFENRLSQVKK
jgi:hypothetical protein